MKESGNHQQLMAEQGVYAALVNAQSLVEQKKEFHRLHSMQSRGGAAGNAAGDAIMEVEAGQSTTGNQ